MIEKQEQKIFLVDEIDKSASLKRLGKLGVFMVPMKSLVTSKSTDDEINFLYSRLRFAMSKTFFKAPLKCSETWQLQALSGLKVDKDKKDNWGSKPAHYYAWAGKLDYLNKKDLKLKNNSGLTPIHFACWSGDLKVLENCRLHYKKYLKKEDTNGLTPLDYAAWTGDCDVLNWLKEHFPKQLNSKDNYGRTPMHLAAWSGAIDWIIKNNPEGVETKDTKGKTTIHYLARSDDPGGLALVRKNHSKWLELQDHDGKTPIHSAALFGPKAMVGWLISDCDETHLNRKDKKGATPIHYIAASGIIWNLAQVLTNKEWSLCNGFNTTTQTVVIKTLVEALKLNRTVISIDYNGVKISEKDQRAIEESLNKNKTMENRLENQNVNRHQFFSMTEGQSSELKVIDDRVSSQVI